VLSVSNDITLIFCLMGLALVGLLMSSSDSTLHWKSDTFDDADGGGDIEYTSLLTCYRKKRASITLVLDQFSISQPIFFAL